ncbi:binding partner of ACD11 1 [Panicum miliaceum]|uniref:Binding partner of ACD11 1 n=1 Tax=Panicum miliaceum TaxID=4540 RepID=A0A3L6TLW8_PANMI|nr:binding partner of ACD11 1 [Panicum miliaceum]
MEVSAAGSSSSLPSAAPPGRRAAEPRNSPSLRMPLLIFAFTENNSSGILMRTVKVSNLSLNAVKREITEFFSFSGDIEYVEMQSESEWSQLAYVTFKDSQGADTAVLLSGATIVDRAVIITPAENYQLPPEAHKQLSGASPTTESAVRKAEDVASSMLAKGFVLSKDALNLARSFDERHNILSNATATVASIDRQYGLSEKINLGRTIVGSKVKEVDERYQVTELTKSALATAEQKASIAGSAILSNQYVSASASWLTSAFGMVTKAAGDMTSMAKDKVERAEEERKAIMWEERNGLVSDYAKIHLDEPSSWEPAVLPLESVDEQKLQAI